MEAFLASHPGALLRPSQLAVLTLEPTSGDRDTGTDPGVDTVNYFFDQAGTFTLALDASANQVGALMLRNSLGEAIARAEHGSVTVSIQPGRYRLDVRHARGGDPSALSQVIFLRRTDTGLLATANCVNCDFDGMSIDGGNFAGLDLSGSTFHKANISSTTFHRATMAACDFDGDSNDLHLTQFEHCDFTGADLTDARFDGIEMSDCSFGGPPPTQGATLSHTHFGDPGNHLFVFINSTDFRNAMLSGATFGPLFGEFLTFQGADLSNSDFTSTVRSSGCVHCDFSVEPTSGEATNLSAAILGRDGYKSLELGGTNLSAANLAGAQLVNVLAEELTASGAIFDQADLSGARLSGALMDGASFRSATLSGTQLSGANLFIADLAAATLTNATLIGANLDFSNLRGANLKGAQLGVAENSEQNPASMVGVYMPDADLTDADLRGVDLSGAHIYGDLGQSKLDGVLLDDADLTGAICSGSQFTGASLTGATFNSAQLVNCTFDGADLTRAIFDSAYLQGASFAGATSVAAARLDNAAVATTSGSWTYTEQNGMPVPYSYGPTQLGAFADDSSVTCPDAQNGPCAPDKLNPVNSGPFPPIPTCVPLPPSYNNCNPPLPPLTPTPVARAAATLR